MLFLVLLVLILSSGIAAAQKAQVVEPAVFLSEFNLQGISEVINYVQQQFKLPAPGTEIFKKITNPRTIAMFLSGLVLLVCLIWLLIRHKKDITETKTCDFTGNDRPAITEQKYEKNTPEALTEKFNSNPDNTFFDEKILSLVEETKAISDSSHNDDIQTSMDIILHDAEKMDVFSDKTFVNQVNINKFISPVKKKSKRKGKNILEAAFENEILANNVGFIQEQKQDQGLEQEQSIENNTPTETDSLNSVDEIRFVNEKTCNSKIDAFLNLTRTEKITEESLSQDFAKIMSNKKVDVFIQEFEDVMSNMTYPPVVNNTTKELENLLQFKLSIHFIKVLSEMMQATYLKQFSTIVIEFLEVVVNGNTRMTTDVTHRLVFVVDFYDGYIHSIKKNHNYKVDA